MMTNQRILDALGKLTMISLSDMDRVKLMNRIDTKFALDKNTLVEILTSLKDHYHVLEIDGVRALSYESLYFDEDNFTFFKDHHNRKINRYKVRIRNYVDSKLFFFEIKHKVKGRTDKKRIKTENFHHDFNELEKGLMASEIHKSYNLVPKLSNSFKRLTLVHKLKNERLTLDFDIKFKNDSQEIVMDQLVIAELKQEKLDRFSPFYTKMKSLGFRPYRLSKYCLGAIELFGKNKLKFNRFKRKLTYLKKINKHAA